MPLYRSLSPGWGVLEQIAGEAASYYIIVWGSNNHPPVSVVEDIVTLGRVHVAQDLSNQLRLMVTNWGLKGRGSRAHERLDTIVRHTLATLLPATSENIKNRMRLRHQPSHRFWSVRLVGAERVVCSNSSLVQHGPVHAARCRCCSGLYAQVRVGSKWGGRLLK